MLHLHDGRNLYSETHESQVYVHTQCLITENSVRLQCTRIKQARSEMLRQCDSSVSCRNSRWLSCSSKPLLHAPCSMLQVNWIHKTLFKSWKSPTNANLGYQLLSQPCTYRHAEYAHLQNFRIRNLIFLQKCNFSYNAQRSSFAPNFSGLPKMIDAHSWVLICWFLQILNNIHITSFCGSETLQRLRKEVAFSKWNSFVPHFEIPNPHSSRATHIARFRFERNKFIVGFIFKQFEKQR